MDGMKIEIKIAQLPNQVNGLIAGLSYCDPGLLNDFRRDKQRPINQRCTGPCSFHRLSMLGRHPAARQNNATSPQLRVNIFSTQ
jgi:hypothetical protein